MSEGQRGRLGCCVKCLPLGLSRENKSAELTFFEGMSLLSGFYADADTEREVVRALRRNQQPESASERVAEEIGALIDDRLQATTVSARLRTLSSVIAEEGIERIDLLKINVEKSELDVLLGIDRPRLGKIRQLVIEVDRQGTWSHHALLEQHGFDLLVEQDPLLKRIGAVLRLRDTALGGETRASSASRAAGAHVRPVHAAK